MRVEPILAFCDRLDAVRIGMEEGLDDWPIASQIWEYKEAVRIIKNLVDENNALSKDADRYRYLRQQWTEVEFVTKDRELFFAESFEASEEDAVYLDKVIDEATMGVKK